jgi:outer membrane lipoprotein carrier protein
MPANGLIRGIFRCLLMVFAGLCLAVDAEAQNAEELARQVQGHYNRLAALKADFRQIYEANSIKQEENGSLWLLRPGLMRWEYREPEAKLFITDGKDTYFYVPSSKQVTVRRLTSNDLRFTPFGFLVGYGDLLKDFEIADSDLKPVNGSSMHALRLLPRRPMENVSSMILEIDARTFQIQALVIFEYTGGISRFEFTRVMENPPLEPRLFNFRLPKGTEVIRLDEP